MNPFKRIKAFFTEARNLIVQLIYTINNLAAVVAENTRLNADLLKASEATRRAVQYLAAVEEHRQRSQGQKADF